MSTYTWRNEQRTRKEMLGFWDTLLGIPEDSGKPRTETEELQLAALQEMLWPTPALLPVEVMRAQIERVLRDLDEPHAPEVNAELYAQAVELQAAIDREDDGLDDYAFGRTVAQDAAIKKLDPKDFYIIPVRGKQVIALTHRGAEKLTKQENK